MAKRSDEFYVGQMVVVTPYILTRYIESYARKVRNRIGIVKTVCPVERSGTYCGHLNHVFVEWQKRNGRGNISIDMMQPNEIEPATEEQIKAWYKPEVSK